MNALAKKPFPWRWLMLGALGVVVLANIHLIYVAVVSQPECVPHHKTADASGGQYRSAKSSC